MVFACLEITSVPNRPAACVDVSSLWFLFCLAFVRKKRISHWWALCQIMNRRQVTPDVCPSPAIPWNASVVVFALPPCVGWCCVAKLPHGCCLTLLVSFLSKSPSSYYSICSAGQSKAILLIFLLLFSISLCINWIQSCLPSSYL